MFSVFCGSGSDCTMWLAAFCSAHCYIYVIIKEGCSKALNPPSGYLYRHSRTPEPRQINWGMKKSKTKMPHLLNPSIHAWGARFINLLAMSATLYDLL